MIQNINFPEGTKYIYTNISPMDFFSEDFEWPNKVDFSPCMFLTNMQGNGSPVYRPINTENIATFDNLYSNINSYAWIPEINIGNATGVAINLYKFNKVLSPIFTGGSTKLGTFSQGYEKTNEFFLEYGYDWTKLKKQLPLGAIVYPYGDVSLRLRILKDGEWLAGDEIMFTRPDKYQPMEYLGGGLYGYTVNIPPREKYRYLIEIDGERYGLNASDEEVVLYIGDNSNLKTEISGVYIMDYVTSNPNGWAYDATVGGIRSNVINHNQTTLMKLELPASTINLQYGQASESNYDYCTIYDGKGNKIVELKEKKTYDETIVITSPDNIFKFEYKKDGSGSNDEDAFWIKSISWESLPPYPEN